MGIHCEISVHKPSDGAFRPGSFVAGCLKYAVDEDMKFARIIISLKGMGNLDIVHRVQHSQNQRHQNNQKQLHYNNKETYVDLDDVLYRDKREIILASGVYETNFKFQLPKNIPASMKYNKNVREFGIKCKITYYIRIKFEKHEFLSFDKRFKKKLDVISGITPRLPTEPALYETHKALTQFFVRKKGYIELKANIYNSIITPGNKISLEYEISNDSNVTINAVKIKLIEVYNFYVREVSGIEAISDVKETDTKTGSIKAGEIQKMDVELTVPSDIGSLEHSRIASREYFVVVKAKLPMPHRNFMLQIPVQIGNEQGDFGDYGDFTHSIDDEAPPSYWESMNEDKSSEK